LSPPRRADLERWVRAALQEDAAFDDATTLATVPAAQVVGARLLARADGVLAGRDLAEVALNLLGGGCVVTGVADGAHVSIDQTVLELRGPARAILAAERVALNYLQHLSGIASLTARFVLAVDGSGARITDTRKTTPGLRSLEKYAVRCGGGWNHRSSLAEMLLVKENHIAAAGSLEAALQAAQRAAAGRVVEIEVRTLDEYARALRLQPDRVLLDHWSPDGVRAAVQLRGPAAARPEIEVSGNLSLETIRAYAIPGVQYLSVGALTHSAPALDLSLLIAGAA
jgi:nicotinate-nucleotide pyrophosphorylase (carboxylating)